VRASPSFFCRAFLSQKKFKRPSFCFPFAMTAALLSQPSFNRVTLVGVTEKRKTNKMSGHQMHP
jgi:hypothetical protein